MALPGSRELLLRNAASRLEEAQRTFPTLNCLCCTLPSERAGVQPPLWGAVEAAPALQAARQRLDSRCAAKRLVATTARWEVLAPVRLPAMA